MTNDYFLDTSAITEQELVDIIMSENNPEITEEMCRQLYKLCVEYSHDGLFATDTKVTIIGSENKSMVEQWMNDVGYYDRTGINPEILLSTLKWEYSWGKGHMDNPFGFLGAHSNTWEGQIDDAITAYMHPYYWSLYNEENGQQLEKEMDPWGDGFVYTSANSAMYSKSQYTTDTLEVLKRWHDTIMNGEW